MNSLKTEILAITALASCLLVAPAAADATALHVASLSTASTLPEVAQASPEFDKARAALDDRDWAGARRLFAEIAASGGRRADEAMYWKAYAETQLRDAAAARSTIMRLKEAFPESNWIDDAEALEIELRGTRGTGELPEDEELKLYALQALMMSNPDKAMPIVKRMIKEGKSEKLKERALFLLLQADTDEARDILGETALGAGSSAMRYAAIRTLGMIGDKEAMAILDRAYRETDDDSLKMQVIHSFMTAGEVDRINRIIQQETDPEIRATGVQMLGIMGETESLRKYYSQEKDPEVRAQMVQAFAIGGDSKMIADILRNEKDPEIRSAAIGSLMMVDVEEVKDLLPKLYRESDSKDERVRIGQVMAMQGQGKQLIELFKQEKDPEVRRHLLQMMAIFGDDETADFILEIIEEK